MKAFFLAALAAVMLAAAVPAGAEEACSFSPPPGYPAVTSFDTAKQWLVVKDDVVYAARSCPSAGDLGQILLHSGREVACFAARFSKDPMARADCAMKEACRLSRMAAVTAEKCGERDFSSRLRRLKGQGI